MSLLRLVTIAIALVLAACVPMGDAWFKFGGVVRDPDGHPIEGARLTIFVNGKPLEHGGETTTDAHGRYSFFESSCPCDFSFNLVADAPGFKPYSLTLNGKQANRLTAQDITLLPQ